MKSKRRQNEQAGNLEKSRQLPTTYDEVVVKIQGEIKKYGKISAAKHVLQRFQERESAGRLRTFVAAEDGPQETNQSGHCKNRQNVPEWVTCFKFHVRGLRCNQHKVVLNRKALNQLIIRAISTSQHSQHTQPLNILNLSTFSTSQLSLQLAKVAAYCRPAVISSHLYVSGIGDLV
jgi:hypothetical protein